jgi:hypothetical protein
VELGGVVAHSVTGAIEAVQVAGETDIDGYQKARAGSDWASACEVCAVDVSPGAHDE